MALPGGLVACTGSVCPDPILGAIVAYSHPGHCMHRSKLSRPTFRRRPMVEMVRSVHDRSLRALVDLERGLVSREIYVNEDLYKQELEQVFARAWLFIGHETQVPNPGDYFQSRMGAEDVLLVRDRKSQIHVFLNTC